MLGGGRSSEHEISLESAKSVLEGLEAADHETIPVLIDREGVWHAADPRAGESHGKAAGDPIALTPGRGLLGADAVFPALHGPFGEDGAVQGLLECLDVPYVGAGVLASALCMDKAAFKRAMAEAGMPQVRYEVFDARDWSARREDCVERAATLGFPQFVKPANLGSSVGISKVTNHEALEQALQLAFDHDPRVLAEAAAIGKEVEISVIGNDDPLTSEPGQVIAKGDWYDFESKYTDGGMELIVPAPISDAQLERVRNIARNAFIESSASGLARIDLFITDEGQVLLNELNTIPGFTSTSVFARLFDASGVGYAELLGRLLDYALERHAHEHKFKF